MSSASEIVIVIEPLQSVTSPAVGSVSSEQCSLDHEDPVLDIYRSTYVVTTSLESDLVPVLWLNTLTKTCCYSVHSVSNVEHMT